MSDEGAHEFGNEEVFEVENESREVQGFVAENEFDREEEESYSVQNKRIKEMSIDRLSALPDGILLHILSFLEWGVKEAAVTCVLSKRWQFLWNELPNLSFWENMCPFLETRHFVSWIHRTIILRRGAYNLEQFEVNFLYDECYALDINTWVRFAVNSKVKQLSLYLKSNSCFYKLPQVLYTHSPLSCLSLERCIIAPQRNLEWPCLTQLTVWDVELPEDTIQKIFSGCPVLCCLQLKSCWGFKRLYVNSKSLGELIVYDSEDKNNVDVLEISAPYLCSLKVSFSPVVKKLLLKNVQSLVSANIHFSVLGYSRKVMNNTKELLEKTVHATNLLVLGGGFVEVVSKLVLHGWRLPQSKRKIMTLETSRDEDSVPGILGLLQSSPNIDTLYIECLDSYEKSVRTWVPAARNDLDCDLSHLKIIRLLNFADPNLAGEPMLTVARILLKRATTLEKMKIKALESLTEFSSEFAKMCETVLGYPRSSKKAVVVLRQ